MSDVQPSADDLPAPPSDASIGEVTGPSVDEWPGRAADESTAAVAVPAPEASPTIVRGRRPGPRLVPRPEPPAGATIITRHMLRSSATVKPQTDRERKIAGDLPDWEPLPPGELRVKRN